MSSGALAGRAGADGINGKDGRDGLPGANGKDGVDGRDGKIRTHPRVQREGKRIGVFGTRRAIGALVSAGPKSRIA